MKYQSFIIIVMIALLSAGGLPIKLNNVLAQGPVQIVTERSHLHQDYHAGVHSGLWTYDRAQILERESKDPHRSCQSPYCNRCSKHLADYGHEYQYVGGPSQRQIWYRGTMGSIAHSTQRCYDEHGKPYLRRGRPAGVMAWEYQHYLNHAIGDQIRARNAVSVEETAESRVAMLNDLYDIAFGRLMESEARWESFKDIGCSCVVEACNACDPCAKTSKGRLVRTVVGDRCECHQCEYCMAQAQYLKDKAYFAEVAKERGLAIADWRQKSDYADGRVRLALLTKEDADKATRFKRIHHKPPKYKDVLILEELAAAEKAAKEKQPTQAPEEGKEESN